MKDWVEINQDLAVWDNGDGEVMLKAVCGQRILLNPDEADRLKSILVDIQTAHRKRRLEECRAKRNDLEKQLIDLRREISRLDVDEE